MNINARTLGTHMTNDINYVKNRIWITERCHMNAERRSRFLELYFHIVLALFALASIGISVLNGPITEATTENILSFVSITTLCLTLLIFGFKFGETAANHRSCYLALQKLRARSPKAAGSLEAEYIEILGHYPNHSSGDYMRLVVSNVFFREQDFVSPSGTKLKLGLWERIVYASHWCIVRLFLILFALMPVFLAAFGIGLRVCI